MYIMRNSLNANLTPIQMNPALELTQLLDGSYGTP